MFGGKMHKKKQQVSTLLSLAARFLFNIYLILLMKKFDNYSTINLPI